MVGLTKSMSMQGGVDIVIDNSSSIKLTKATHSMFYRYRDAEINRIATTS
jgi:hypothetical protein